jgi:hypothetical protein
MERISETLFGLIMALTFISSIGVATSGNIQIQAMLICALGCNLAWGIVDGGLDLLARINERCGFRLELASRVVPAHCRNFGDCPMTSKGAT